MLTDDEKRFLREVAADAVRAALTGADHRIALPGDGPLARKGSVFVTLRKGGRLRGCIGLIGDHFPLARCVREAAARALRDPRFPPPAAAEVPDLDFEISVLGPFTAVGSPGEVEVGRHGLFLAQGWRSGLLLPQVPVEQGWDRDTYLEQICAKAGLPAGAHEDPDATLEVFEADVF